MCSHATATKSIKRNKQLPAHSVYIEIYSGITRLPCCSTAFLFYWIADRHFERPQTAALTARPTLRCRWNQNALINPSSSLNQAAIPAAAAASRDPDGRPFSSLRRTAATISLRFHKCLRWATLTSECVQCWSKSGLSTKLDKWAGHTGKNTLFVSYYNAGIVCLCVCLSSPCSAFQIKPDHLLFKHACQRIKGIKQTSVAVGLGGLIGLGNKTHRS